MASQPTPVSATPGSAALDVSAPPPRAGTHLRLRHVPNAVSALILFAARLTVAVAQLRIVDKYWGGSYTGLNALSNQVLLYVTLLELGLSQSAITFLYEPIVGSDVQRVSGIVLALRHDVRMLASIGALAAVPALLAYAHVVHGNLPFLTVAGTLLCIAGTGLLQLAAVHFQVYLNAAERLDKVNYTFAAGYLLKTAIGLPLAIAEHNYLLLPATIALLTLGEFAALKLAFHHTFPEFRRVPWRDEASRIRKRAKYVVIQKVAGIAYYQSDFIILSLTTSLVAVKDYAKFQYVAAALLSVVGMVGSSLTTSVARMQMRQHSEDRRRRYVTAQLLLCLIGAVLMLGFWFTAPAVVRLAFGSDLAITTQLVVLFGVALFLNIVKIVDDIFIMAKGAFEIGFWVPAIEVPAYVITGVVLSRRIGIAGILIASIATNLVVSVGLKGAVLARPIFDSTIRQWYLGRAASIGKAAIFAIPLLCTYLLVRRFLHLTLLQASVSDTFALLYMVAGVRWVLSGRLKARTAPL